MMHMSYVFGAFGMIQKVYMVIYEILLSIIFFPVTHKKPECDLYKPLFLFYQQMIQRKFGKFFHPILVVMHHLSFLLEVNYQKISMDYVCQVKMLNVQYLMFLVN